MKLIGLMVVRNEAWVLPASLEAALQWLDSIIILTHACTDQTEAIVDGFALRHPGRIEYGSIYDPEWNEATYRGRALAIGRSMGGTHFAVLDADEILTTSAMRSIRMQTESLVPGEVLRLPWLQCWRSLDRYRCDDSPFGTARMQLVFCDAPHLAYAPDGDGYQLHKRFPRGLWIRDFGSRNDGGLLHLQHASWNRVTAKQQRYVEDEVRRWPGRRSVAEIAAQYAPSTDETGLETTAIPDSWWPVDRSLIDLDAEPWHALLTT